MARRSYAGNTQPTTLASPITNVDTSMTVVSGTNYPDGSVAPAILTIDAGVAGEEKVLYTTRTGNVYSGLTRGYDGTTAVSHSAGASVRHSYSALDANEANAHVNDATRDDHTQYGLRSQGLFANRPSTGFRAGRRYYATDQDREFIDDGSGWHELLTTTTGLTPAAANAAYVSLPLVDAKGDLLVGSADNTVVRKAVGTDGQVLTADTASAGGVKWAAAAAASGVVVSRRAVRTAGTLSVTSTTFTAADTALDLTMPAATGDIIEVAPNGLWGPEAITGEMDVATMVSGSPVNYVSGSNARGVGGWSGPASQSESIGGPVQYTLVAGDISGGNVTLRLMVKVLTAGTKTLFAQSNSYPLYFSVKNLSH